MNVLASDPPPTRRSRSLAARCASTSARAKRRVDALRGVEFDARLGELSFLVGPSGCGKTTLISVIAGLLDRDAGELTRPRAPDGRSVGLGPGAVSPRQHRVRVPAVQPAAGAHRRRKRRRTAARRRNAAPSGAGAVGGAARAARIAVAPRGAADERSRAGSSSAWRSPDRWFTSRGWWSATSRPPPSITTAATR